MKKRFLLIILGVIILLCSAFLLYTGVYYHADAVALAALKSDENGRLSLGWNLNRELTKINYHIHTDAIKEHLIPENISAKARSFIYADEADVLNVALFGMTAKMWREQNPESKGNIRDHASLHQLIVLVNLESMNAELIKSGLSQAERAIRLNQMAINQLQVLNEHRSIKLLE